MVEHPFHIVKNRFHHKKLRYRGLTKNTAQLYTLFALANLVIVKQACSPDQVNKEQVCPDAGTAAKTKIGSPNFIRKASRIRTTGDMTLPDRKPPPLGILQRFPSTTASQISETEQWRGV